MEYSLTPFEIGAIISGFSRGENFGNGVAKGNIFPFLGGGFLPI